MAVNENSCQDVDELLVAYADGELAAEPAERVSAHLAACEKCRCKLAALERSLDLARAVWKESADAMATPAAEPVRRRPRWIRAAAAAAACIVLAVGLAVPWLATRPEARPPGLPPDPRHSAAGVRTMIQREEASARLAASARILSVQPGAEQAAEDAYRYLASAYSDTPAGREAARRILPQ